MLIFPIHSKPTRFAKNWKICIRTIWGNREMENVCQAIRCCGCTSASNENSAFCIMFTTPNCRPMNTLLCALCVCCTMIIRMPVNLIAFRNGINQFANEFIEQKWLKRWCKANGPNANATSNSFWEVSHLLFDVCVWVFDVKETFDLDSQMDPIFEIRWKFGYPQTKELLNTQFNKPNSNRLSQKYFGFWRTSI